MTSSSRERIRRAVEAHPDGISSRELAHLIDRVSTKGVARILASEPGVEFDVRTATWRSR